MEYRYGVNNDLETLIYWHQAFGLISESRKAVSDIYGAITWRLLSFKEVELEELD